ncbi:MAG: glutathione S-transferase [Pseudomonadota bacterium]
MQGDPADALKVWGRRSAFNVQKVLWLIDELDLDYQHIDAGGSAGGLDAPEFLAMNPHGRIPVIDDGGTIVWESHAILRYLAARYASERLWSGDPAARSEADRWMDWSQTTLQPVFLHGVFWGYFRTPEPQRNWPAIDKALEQCSAHFRLLDRWLADRDFMTGNALSLADMPIGTCLYRYFELDIERPDIPNVEAWYARLQERQADRDHVMLPFEELRGRAKH